MAEALPQVVKFSKEKECRNCKIFGWKQPDDRSRLQRCTRCKLVWYCSKQCQKEHWYNAHKHHCKYLALRKVLPKAKHDEATCLVCKDESMAGQVNMSKPSNTVLPCYMSTANKKFMGITSSASVGPEVLAKPLGEMTGNYSKLDATFAIMLRILVKMKMTNHIIWRACKSSAEQLYSILLEIRGKECRSQLFTKPGTALHDVAFISEEASIVFDNALKDIDTWFLTRNDQYGPLVLPWCTFKILYDFARNNELMKGSLIGEYLGASDMAEEFGEVRITHSKFHNLWENMLDKLKEGLVPWTTLVEVLCEGNLVQQCHECGVQVHVQNVVALSAPVIGLFQAVPHLIFGCGFIYSLCGKFSCCKSIIKDSDCIARTSLLRLYARLLWEYVGEECDYCGGFNQEVKSHRCSGCRTKVYCGVECLNKDEVHLKLCEGEKRKRKPSSGSRREKGRMALEEFLSGLSL